MVLHLVMFEYTCKVCVESMLEGFVCIESMFKHKVGFMWLKVRTVFDSVRVGVRILDKMVKA